MDYKTQAEICMPKVEGFGLILIWSTRNLSSSWISGAEILNPKPYKNIYYTIKTELNKASTFTPRG